MSLIRLKYVCSLKGHTTRAVSHQEVSVIITLFSVEINHAAPGFCKSTPGTHLMSDSISGVARRDWGVRYEQPVFLFLLWGGLPLFLFKWDGHNFLCCSENG